MIGAGTGLFIGIALVYTMEKYGILVASSCLASLLIIGGIIFIKLDKKNTQIHENQLNNRAGRQRNDCQD